MSPARMPKCAVPYTDRSNLTVPVADKIGMKLSAKACFDPTAAPECVLFCLHLPVTYAGLI